MNIQNSKFKIQNLKSRSAFSLVEATLSLGIISFAMIAIFGLLPVGLQSYRDAREQAASSGVLMRIAHDIRNGNTGTYGSEVASGGTVTDVLTLDGEPTGAADARLALYAIITQPATLGEAGTAVIHLAWPATATFSTDDDTWTGASGSAETAIRFLAP